MAEPAERGGRGAEEQAGPDIGAAPQPLCLDSAVSVSRCFWSSNQERRKKLVLHIDLNNTILISDALTSHGTVAALESFLTTVTWGRMSRGPLRFLLEFNSLVSARATNLQ